MSPVPPGPATGTTHVTPQDVQNVAKTFYDAQTDLENAWYTLQTTLDNNSGMAGNDSPAQTFNTKYSKALTAAWKGLTSSTLTLGGISQGLTSTATNFVTADHASTAKGAKGPAPTFPPYPVTDGISMATPDSATGPGGETVWFLPGPLEKFWPNAHTGKLRAAGTAWHTMATTIDTVVGKAQISLTSLEVDDDTTKAINGFWQQVYSPGNQKTVLAGTRQLCQALGDACNKQADIIDKKRGHVKDLLVGAGIAVGITSIIGIAATIFTGGGSDAAAGVADEAEVTAIVGDVAADTAAETVSEVGAVMSDELVAAVEAAADDAPAVETAGAEVTQVETEIDESLDEALAADGGESSLSQETLQQAYDYANTDAKLTHIIDPAKHGFADLVQAAGGRSQAMKLIVDSLGAGQDLPGGGPFVVTRLINGATVTIRGAMVNGIPKIGTAFIAAAFPGP